MNKPFIEVRGHRIGHDFEPQVVAEIGINHGGSIDTAKEMVKSAAGAGIRFLKHQTHIASLEMSREAQTAIPGNSDLSIFDVITQNSLTFEEEFELARYAESQGMTYFSTPFSREAADFLAHEIDVPLFKIGSGECNNYPFVKYVASKKKPIILSTGMNSISTIRPAVAIIEEANLPYALLHTTNLYPTPLRLVRTDGIRALADTFPNAVIGLSDHSTSNSACYAGVALGSSLLERHFTDDKSRVGPDIICSMDQEEASDLIKVSREIFLARGGEKEAAIEEAVTMNFAFSSVAALIDIKIGETLTEHNIFPIRPGGGDFGPGDYPKLLGKKAKRQISARTQLRAGDVESE